MITDTPNTQIITATLDGMSTVMIQKHMTTEISQVNGVDGCYALAHVDDCLVVGTDADVKQVKTFLATKFKIKDMGDVSIFTRLVIERHRTNRTIQISQAHYAKQIIDMYGM